MEVTTGKGPSYNGEPVVEFYLKNKTSKDGVEITLINLGAAMTSLKTVDKDGNKGEVTLYYEDIQDISYKDKCTYYGATIGRFGNRIANGKFTVEGKEYQVATNNGPNHLHGGIEGLDKKRWNYKTFSDDNSCGVLFECTSKDGEEGYPGNLKVTTKYTLFKNNDLEFLHTAETDKATPVNLTNHTYWNLEGPENGSVLKHIMHINAYRYLPVDATLIPLGELKNLVGSEMDFTTPTPIGSRIEEVKGGGYDHCYVLNKDVPVQDDSFLNGLTLAARVIAPVKGRVMEVYTDQYGIQFYSCNFLDNNKGANGVAYNKHGGFCLETENFPDAINQKSNGFPDAVLNPGQTYSHRTVHRFSTKSS